MLQRPRVTRKGEKRVRPSAGDAFAPRPSLSCRFVSVVVAWAGQPGPQRRAGGAAGGMPDTDQGPATPIPRVSTIADRPPVVDVKIQFLAGRNPKNYMLFFFPFMVSPRMARQGSSPSDNPWQTSCVPPLFSVCCSELLQGISTPSFWRPRV
jgi:hypothetical protein